MQIKVGRFDKPHDPRQWKLWNFADPEEDPVIPVVLVFATRDPEYSFGPEQTGPEILFLRRKTSFWMRQE